MNARITIDGNNILTVNKDGKPMDEIRDALRKVAVTANPTAKTAISGAKFFANASAVADKLSVMGTSESVVEFFELPEGKKEERLAARYTLENFVNRLRLTAIADTVSGTIFADESTKKSTTGKTEQATDLD